MTTLNEPVPAPAWSTARGHNTVGAVKPFDDESLALNRLLVVERLYRYGWSYDERRTDLIADCFTEDAVWDAVSMGVDVVGPVEGRQNIVEFLVGFQDAEKDQRRHMFTNPLVDDLTDRSAVVHSYFLLTASKDRIGKLITPGLYRTEMVKEDGVWRISHMSGGFDGSLG